MKNPVSIHPNFEKRRAQAWGFDMIVATTIFIIGILTFYVYASNYANEGEEKIISLEEEGDVIAEILLSEGYPTDWSVGNVLRPGILSENKINQTKLDNLYNLSISDYEKMRALFTATHNFYINFSEGMFISGIPIEGIGKKPINAKNLIKISRYTIYNNTPITLFVEVWE